MFVACHSKLMQERRVFISGDSLLVTILYKRKKHEIKNKTISDVIYSLAYQISAQTIQNM